jgi:LemA protein
MKSKGLLILLAILGILFFWGCNLHNGLVGKGETIDKKWADVQVQYQRRADVFMNQVEAVKGAAANERRILEAVTNARGGIQSAKDQMGKAASPAELEASLQAARTAAMNFKVTVEAYPAIRSTEAFLKLQDEISGTENRISKVREDYNETVRPFNTSIKTFPNLLIANLLGHKERAYFEADADAQKAKKIDLGTGGNTQPTNNSAPSGSGNTAPTNTNSTAPQK